MVADAVDVADADPLIAKDPTKEPDRMELALLDPDVCISIKGTTDKAELATDDPTNANAPSIFADRLVEAETVLDMSALLLVVADAADVLEIDPDMLMSMIEDVCRDELIKTEPAKSTLTKAVAETEDDAAMLPVNAYAPCMFADTLLAVETDPLTEKAPAAVAFAADAADIDPVTATSMTAVVEAADDALIAPVSTRCLVAFAVRLDALP